MNKFLCKAGSFNIAIGDFKMAMDCDNMNSLESNFNDHMSNFGLSYATKEEYLFRLDLFKLKDAEINEINSKQSSFTVGHNEFSTMTPMELKQRLGDNTKPNPQGGRKYNFSMIDNEATEVDWRKVPNIVNPVKNQASCGSCWAFSATAVVESANAISTGKLLSLSEQQLVSCSKNGNMGCNGGMSYDAFEYLQTHAQETEEDYPYTSATGLSSDCLEESSKG
jgi:xylem cysteine proteinase